MKKNLIVIAGPTAVGKTALSVELAKQYGCPVVSADSRQFYADMSIGTARPTCEEMQQVPHYFIGQLSIHEPYNAGLYERDAMACLDTLFKAHDQLILVGGSGLYIHAVLNGVDEFEEIPAGIREELSRRYETEGIAYLQESLKQKDAAYYREVDLNNPQRLMRALEVCLHTGKPYSSFRRKEKKERPFGAVSLLMTMDREQLYERINRRVDEMMNKGLLEEVQRLYPFKHFNALNTVGYRELFDYLDGQHSLDRAVELIQQNTRRYAKRQLTWFSHQGNFEPFHPSDTESIQAYLHQFIAHS